MTDNEPIEKESQISRMLKNFMRFFIGDTYQSSWRESFGYLMGTKEDLRFLQNIINDIDWTEQSLLSRAINIAARYQDKEFDYKMSESSSYQKISDLFDARLLSGFLPNLAQEIRSLCVNNSRDERKIYDWIKEYLAKIDLDKIEGILTDFSNQSALIKATKEAVRSKAEADKREAEADKIASELKVSGEWDRHFSERANEIKKEIKKSWIRKRIRALRSLLYALPIIALVADFGIVGNWEDTSFLKLIIISTSAILLLSIISYHLKHALRELNILKQMSASYLHRAITAKTFRELVDTKHFKDAQGEIVVREAASAMFKKDSVGYLSKDQLEPSSIPIQEVVKVFSAR